ncbi:MAG TPA: DmsE family decaheme c-type cytochrome [Nitrospirota bacterium]
MAKLHGFRLMLSSLLVAMGVALLPIAASAQAGYAGAATCAGCHEEIALNFSNTLHAKAGYWVAGYQDCETCHGPGEEHAGSADPTKIRGPKAFSEMGAEFNSICLDCHLKGKLAHWDSGTHSARNLVCVDCHSIHHGMDKLLKTADQKDVCFQCHGDVKVQITKSSHHPIREGKITCSDCHNPHGTIAPHQIDAVTINNKCYECHAEKRGPFLWEHRPAVEDCTICHTPHGTNHEKLLRRKNEFLCQECHSNRFHPGRMYATGAATDGPTVFQSLGDQGIYRMCLNCHTNIHGSNHPSGNRFLR